MNFLFDKPAALFFDLDGTLIDTAPDFIQVLNQQLHLHGQEALSETSIRNTVSDGARALTQLAFGGEAGEALFEARRQELLDLYLQIAGDHSPLFPGMTEVLAACESSNIPWGIVTNKPRLYSERMLAKMGLNERLSTLICPDDLSHSKPDPEGLVKAAEICKVKPEACIYVGDHLRDIQAAKAANMTSIAARYGYIRHADSVAHWGADAMIDHAEELLRLIRLI